MAPYIKQAAGQEGIVLIGKEHRRRQALFARQKDMDHSLDIGDIQLDGQSAQRFVETCQRNGITVNKTTIKDIDIEKQEAKYSCRQILIA